MISPRRIAPFLVIIFLVTLRIGRCEEYLLVGAQGQISVLSPDGVTTSLATGEPFSKHGRYKLGIMDTVLGYDTTATLYVAAVGLYSIQPFAAKPEYIRIEEAGQEIRVQRTLPARRPVISHFSGDGKGKLLLVSKGKQLLAVSPDQLIVFPSPSSFSVLIPESRLSSEELMRKHPHTKDILSKYPNREWIMRGQSMNLTMYARIQREEVSADRPFTGTYLLQDRSRGNWTIYSTDAQLTPYIFQDIAVSLGNTFYADEYGNLQRKPSGNMYIYTTRSGTLEKLPDPGKRVLYATADTIILGNEHDRQLFRMTLADGQWSEPKPWLNLDFYAIAVLPLDNARPG